jgi:hypothetical protein
MGAAAQQTGTRRYTGSLCVDPRLSSNKAVTVWAKPLTGHIVRVDRWSHDILKIKVDCVDLAGRDKDEKASGATR